MKSPVLAPILIFTATYLVLALGRLPGLRVDRTGATIIGASLMLAFNVLTVQEAWAAIDYDTVLLLFGMMIVVANLRLSGFFAVVSAWVVRHAHRPLPLLSGIVLVSGIFSAFFVNDTMCLVLTPLVVEITGRLRRNPVPYLLAVAMAANIGSVATITGNPQNMMIGSFSRIPYARFAAALSPIAGVGLVLTVAVIALVYWGEFRKEAALDTAGVRVRVNRALLWKSLAVSIGMIVFFFAGWPVPKVAVIAGALLLVTRRIKPERVYREIDWSLLVMFIGLFIVVAGLEKTPVPGDLFSAASRYHLDRIGPMTAFTALLSNLVSNVPAVLVFKGFVPHLPDPARAWLILAMSSTLAGNLTVLGSVANLIVLQKAKRDVDISFWEYARTGIPLTVLTLAAGACMLR
ncbi:MAG: anion transporter [Candidatus Sulfopaludibacter sp.]|nr:anion transporter [Candidatus Sulfopaludibacter sp.]